MAKPVPGDIVIGSATLAVVMYGLFEATLGVLQAFILGRGHAVTPAARDVLYYSSTPVRKP